MEWKLIPNLMRPGVKVKRWIALLLLSSVLLGLGLASLIQEFSQGQEAGSLLWYIALRFIEEPLRSLSLVIAGISASMLALVQLNRALINILVPQIEGGRLAVVYDREATNKPNVVIFGSGIGLLIFLNSIKDMVSGVTVVLPMGEDMQLYRELLNANQLGLLRNVFIATLPNATICAEFSDGYVLEGFLAIKESHRYGSINRLFARYRDDLPPAATVPENAEILKAIESADAIILGPASLFVGIIPSLLAKDVATAVNHSRAAKIFVCNIMTEPGKTDGYSVSRHVSALEQHGGFYLDYVILNNKRVAFDLAKKYHESGADQVLLDFDEFENSHIKVNLADRSGEVRMLNRAVLIEEDLISAAVQRVLEGGTNPRYESDSKLVVRHDSEKMRAVFERVFDLMAQRPRGSA
ncbi:MAG: YvcK family protein [Chloroflexi bacterium]|nr:YvcK family protein [Chloroflexota bacterium]